MIKNTNDGKGNEPYLRVDMNYLGCEDLPEFSEGPRGDDLKKHNAIKNAGFAGIQDGDPAICSTLGLNYTAHARINNVGDLDELLPRWKEEGYDCASLHAGWGLESDAEVDNLVEYILNKSTTENFPLYLETHRATITQDMQRTVELIKRFPEIRFNGDFSHWYTGQEMVYGGIEMKWDFIQPVFDRVRFMHGRIGNPGCIQVNIEDDSKEYVGHFNEMWTRSFEGFLKSAQPGDFLSFTVELLQAEIFYARTQLNNELKEVEEGDRWQQAILYKEIVRDCWREAKNRNNS
ncbi:hypothetical protein [Autumnicola musiva]|uniref:Xylose isomerase-like TIM barrel domain-containing protein n=1 Tax=Autumnicola musiva TaxID=3075589 RepID=A0ABU3D7V9_9FLAO|nr:hypothetical protein [Zunongwangia sp. F117]MDT0677622.1 hypothetical protein [Zunongwangia sp. F117]